MSASPTLLPMLLTPREAARALSVCEKTLFTLSKRGEIPAVRIGRSVRYDPTDLARWIDSRKTARANQVGPISQPLVG